MGTAVQPLDRIAIELGPLTVYWYGIIIGFGAMLGLYLAVRESKRLGMNPDTFVDVVLIAVPAAILSARLYYVAFEWDYYRNHPGDILAIWEGGIAIHGALIGALLTAYIFSKVKNLSFWKLADIAAPSILLGQAIGRWGNFINQEAHGGEVSRAYLENLYLPDWIVNQMFINGSYYHPTFLYESIWSFAGVLFLLVLRRFNLRRGELFLSYVIWYSFGRYFIEGMRTDSLMLTQSLRVAQVLSIVLIVSSILAVILRRKKRFAKHRYEDG